VVTSIVFDALAGIGCMTLSCGLFACGVFCLAVRLGLLPGVSAALSRLTRKPDDT